MRGCAGCTAVDAPLPTLRGVESPQPHAPVPHPTAAFEDVMTLDPIVLRPWPPRHHFDHLGRYGRDDAANMMAGNPDPGGAAPRPMAWDPVVAGTRGRRNDFDPRRRHDAPLDNHGRLCRRDADPTAQRQHSGASRPQEMTRGNFHDDFS